ncbi:MAG TPA: hypothetical protein VGI05_20660 [Streptosporangiaceae bacterium]|jgi:hypothetical protein
MSKATGLTHARGGLGTVFARLATVKEATGQIQASSLADVASNR